MYFLKKLVVTLRKECEIHISAVLLILLENGIAL